MSLMDIEKQIAPLLRNEKLQLMQYISSILLEEAEDESAAGQTSEFQPDPEEVEMMRIAAKEPYWPLYDQHEAAKTLLEVADSELSAS